MPVYLDNLNENQRQAATIVPGYVRILAVAGTGKTHTLISRVAYMIDSGIAPSSILLLTFTKKAAQEMKDRLKQYIGPVGEQVTASTFHSFIWSVMRAYSPLMGVPANARILSTGDDEALLRSCCKAYQENAGFSAAQRKEFPSVSQIAGAVSFAANSLQPLSQILSQSDKLLAYQTEIQEILQQYCKKKQELGYYNYDDLLTEFLAYLEQNPDFVILFNQMYPYVMCDEYQDTNILQDRILSYMTQHSHNLCVVGDDNQSIYRFRGAEVSNILTFDTRHPGCQTVALTENYRSSQAILDVSNAMMEDASEGIPKKLHGQYAGLVPDYLLVNDDRSAADFIIQQIQGNVQAGGLYREHCILVRKASTSYILEQMLLQAGIPYRKYGGRRFTEEHVVQVLLSFLRISVNPKDALAWRTVLLDVPGLGATSMERLIEVVPTRGAEILSQTQSCIRNGITVGVKLSHLAGMYPALCQEPLVRDKVRLAAAEISYMLKEAMAHTKSQQTQEKLEKWLAALSQHVATLQELAQHRKDVTDFVDELLMEVPADNQTDEVCISTIHSAKGLEWKHVYVLHPVENVFVDMNATPADLAEERRVLYVAMTRAKESLKLIQCKQMLLNGKCVPTMLSSFLSTNKCLQCLNAVSLSSAESNSNFDDDWDDDDWDD